MKKIILCSVLIFTLAVGASCGRFQNTAGGGAVSGRSVSGEAVSGEVVSGEAPEESLVAEREANELEEAYKSFLDNLYRKKNSSKGNYFLSFLLRDMDSDSIPDLIIKKNTKFIIYTYTDKVVKVGKTGEFGGTGRYFYSNKSLYPGIFCFWVGGGYEHYGYIYIENNHVIFQELWNEDFTGISKILGKNREKIEEISSDKQIIDESKIVYDENQELVFREVVPLNYQVLDMPQ